MNTGLALNLLKNYGSITVTKHSWLNFARKLALTDPFKAEWLNFKRSYDKKDSLFGLPNIHSENTYDTCVSAEIRAYNNQIIFTVTVYDGDMLNGDPQGARCSFEFKLNHCPSEFWPLLDRQLENAARHMIEKEDRAIYERRVADAGKKLAAALSGETA